jgi:hypothetical protein
MPGTSAPPGGGGAKIKLTPHRPTRKKPRSTRPYKVVGGSLPANPDPTDHKTRYTLIIAFPTDFGTTAFTQVTVRVLGITATHVLVESTNAEAVNVAPQTKPPHQEVIIEAHRKAAISKTDLKSR